VQDMCWLEIIKWPRLLPENFTMLHKQQQQRIKTVQ